MFGKRNKNGPEPAKGNSVKKNIKHHSRCGLMTRKRNQTAAVAVPIGDPTGGIATGIWTKDKSLYTFLTG